MAHDLLSSAGEWKVMELFLGQPWERFYLREIIRKAGVSPNTAVRAARKMESEGILSSESVGNVRSYRLAAGSEMAKKLLMLHHEKRLQKLPNEFRAYVSRLREKLRPDGALVLFGSVAKGKAGPESDIDILVISDRKADEKKIAKIFEKHSRYVQVTSLKKEEFDKWHRNGNELVINILKSGLVLHDNDFYINYLFRPLPKPTKKYIEGMLKDVSGRLEALWKMYRMKEGASMATPSLHPVIYRMSVSMILLSRQIPESKEDVEDKLRRMGEKKMSRWFSITKRIWDGERIDISKGDVERILDMLEDKLKECFMKLGEYHE